MSYKNFNLNGPSTPKPWGAVEEQNWKDIIDTVVGDCVTVSKDTAGHRHTKLYDANGVAVVIVSTSSGNVGIGTTAPLDLLEIAPGTNYTGLSVRSSHRPMINIENTFSDEEANLQFKNGTPQVYKLGLSNAVNNELTLLDITRSKTLLHFNSSGNVGIGTIAPGYKLDVAGDVNISSGNHYKINGVNLTYGDIGGSPALSLTPNYLPKAATASTLGNSQIIDDGSDIDIAPSGSVTLQVENTGSVGIYSNTGGIQIQTTGGDISLYGSSSKITMYGGTGIDITSGTGDITITPATGRILLTGGTGKQVRVTSRSETVVIESLTSGDIEIISYGGDVNLTAHSKIQLSPGTYLTIGNLSSYTSNAAAISGIGFYNAIYRNGDNICITHA
jgi:hypothetical protein